MKPKDRIRKGKQVCFFIYQIQLDHRLVELVERLVEVKILGRGRKFRVS